ncbi:MAG: Cys-tRNA(Pro) deacylase [Candidatus Bathyarchaeota archaeon]|nr:Cys-tRNA(Pro) deacylase [Candidatus Bathyarchaeota archaeon]
MSMHFPVTPATTLLDKEGIIYGKHIYDYLRKGADVAAGQLNVNSHVMIKTLIMQKEDGEPLIVLMHGDKEVSLKELARQIGAKSIQPCNLKDAEQHTGYLVGGISPFGVKKQMPVYIEEELLSFPQIWINGGQRGFIIDISPASLVKILSPKVVKVAR